MWIYYKTKSHPPGSVIKSSVITTENIQKLFDSDTRAISWTGGKRLPLKSFAWDSSNRFTDKFEEHPIFGKVFIPKSIMAYNAKINYFIVLIDGKVGIRRWPSFRAKNDKKLDHVNLTAEEVTMLEQCFTQLLEETGINKTIKQKYKNVKGIALKQEPLLKLITLIIGNASTARPIANEIFEASAEPVKYFEKNQRALKKLQIDEPDKDMYLWLLIAKLSQLNKIGYLDWRSDADEVNSILKDLGKKSDKPILNREVTYKDTFQMLKLAGKLLKQKGFILASIATNADSYAVIKIKASEILSLRSLAKACRIKIDVL